MSGIAATVIAKKRSMFDIKELNDSKTKPDVSTKHRKIECSQAQDKTQSSETPLFEDDGFEDLDLSIVETQYANKLEQQGTILAAEKLDERLTSEQKARAKKNRQKALSLKQARLISRPDTEKGPKECFLTGENLESQFLASQPTEKKTIDTGAGFFIEDEEDTVER